MKISPIEMSSSKSVCLDEITVEVHANHALSEIAKPIIDGYNESFAPVVNRPFVIFISGLLFFVCTLLYLTP